MLFEADDLEDNLDIDQDLLSHEGDAVETVNVVEKLERKQKKKQKRKLVETEESVSKKRRKLDGKEGKPAGESIALQTPTAQAEYVFALFQKVYKTSSSLELEEMRYNESAFVDTRSYTNERSVESLGEFISEVIPTLQVRLTQRSATKGAPTVLFITSSAIRAADVARSFRSSLRGPKSGEVAKLFAKHFKLSDHAKYLENTFICAGVGTAGRIGKLLSETGSLSVKALTHIIVDTHLDVKQRSIFDIPETREALIKDVLANNELRKAIESRKVSIVLF